MIQIILALSLFTYAPIKVGNGGDAVVCQFNETPEFYALDFLLLDASEKSKLAPVVSIYESLFRILSLLEEKQPELAPSFKEFIDFYLNEDNLLAPRLWVAKPFGLIDLKDENIKKKLPDQCFSGNQVQLTQAVIRQEKENQILYHFVPEVVSLLEETNPLQLSFLIVHEWLWDITQDVNTLRELNRRLHSQTMLLMDSFIDHLEKKNRRSRVQESDFP